MTADDLEMVLSWRNHPEIQRHMYNRNAITPEEHRQWFLQCSNDSKRHLIIYQEKSTPKGFVNFREISNNGIVDWGFYTKPNSEKGTGRKLAIAALQYGFLELGFHKVVGQVIDSNKRSIQFHLRIGFSQEEIIKDHYFDGSEYHDVWCFGLFASDWKNTTEKQNET